MITRESTDRGRVQSRHDQQTELGYVRRKVGEGRARSQEARSEPGDKNTQKQRG